MSFAITADFKTSPYIHQLKEFEYTAEKEAHALLWQMRTGKTKVIIDTACHLFTEGKIDSVILFAPNGVHINWINRELKIHHWDTVPYFTNIWQTSLCEIGLKRSEAKQYEHEDWWLLAKSSLKSKNNDKLVWWSFNTETMIKETIRKLIARIVKNKRILIVFDESHDFRTPGSKRTKMARALAKKCTYRRILTGTPVTNSPLHAFSQFELLKPGCLGFKTYKDFKNRYAIYDTARSRDGRQYQVLVDYKNLEELKYKISQFSSIILRENCEDLPELVYSKRKVLLNPNQIRLYKQVQKEFELQLDEYSDTEVSIGENTTKFIKMQQIVSGYIIDEFGDIHNIPGQNNRLKIVKEEVSLCSGKVIIWCRFREDVERVTIALKKAGYKTLQYYGAVGEKFKQVARDAFAPNAKNDIKVLVGYPIVGLDLSAASKIIWYSHTFDAILREQANERATKIGGTNIEIIDLEAPGIDTYILDTLSKKQKVANKVVTQEVLNKISI